MNLSLLDLFPSELTTSGKDRVPTKDALAGAEVVGIYFSAHWCPPCRGFTPKLSDFYTRHGASKKLKIVFATSDNSASEFEGYLSEMSFKLAIPFEDPKIQALSAKYKVRGIPTLVFVDKDGNTITTDGRSKVMGDPDAEEFPWAPKSLSETLKGTALTDRDGKATTYDEVVSKTDGLIGFYFSAHWCPPCRGFTPELAMWYEKHCLPGKDLHGKAEIIFVSADRSQDQFKEYFAEMPWKALPFDNKKVVGALNSAFEVEGIPTLVFVDAKTGEVVTKDGRERISNSPEGFPWPPRPVETLDDAMNFINDTAVCVVFAENADDDAIVVAASEALEKVANEYFKDGKPDAKIRFALSTSANEDAALSIRNFLGGVHKTDRAGADAIRVTIIDVPNRTKALFKDGKLGPVDAGELAAFVKSYLEGSAKTVGIKA